MSYKYNSNTKPNLSQQHSSFPSAGSFKCRAGVLLYIAIHSDTSVKLSYELGKITFSTGKPKLTPGEVSTFQGF